MCIHINIYIYIYICVCGTVRICCAASPGGRVLSVLLMFFTIIPVYYQTLFTIVYYHLTIMYVYYQTLFTIVYV